MNEEKKYKRNALNKVTRETRATAVLNLLFTFVWLLVGHFCGIFSHFFSFVYFPLLFILSANFFRYQLNSVFVIPFYYLLILANDYLFRIFGGGIHDDSGRGLCQLIFYLTILSTTIAMFVVAYIIAKNKTYWIYNSLLVIGSAIVSYFVFLKFNVKV